MMMELLRSFVSGGGTSEVIRECRDCGTVVDEEATSCSHCDSTDIVRYEIE